jgi:uncharacterized sulfatase
MERLAGAGMTFSHAFVVSPSCAPSRAALLTGLTPNRNGSMLNHQLPRAEVKKWPAYFRELGYETAAIGKTAHYAQVRQYGFDHASHFTYHEDTCIAAAVEWLEKRAGSAPEKPLCIIVGTNWSHVPWPVKHDVDPAGVKISPTQVETDETRAARARYDAAVKNADRDLGIIYDAVRKTLGDNTLFVFTSDHGAQFPFGKWNCTDAGLRTPLIAAWPGKIEAGSRSDVMATWLNLLPTFIDAAGGENARGTETLSGRSLLPVLRGKEATGPDAVFATHSGDGRMNRYPVRSVRTRNFRYVRNLDPAAEFHSHVDLVDDEHYWASWVEKARTDAGAAATVARYFKRPAEELYDVNSDPYELKNLAADPAHAAMLAQLRGQLDAWMREQGDDGLATERALPEIAPGKGKAKAAGAESQ